MNSSRRGKDPLGSAHRARGAVLVETCVVMSFLLVCVFMTLGIGLAGFQEISADGASFVAGHSRAIRSTADAPSVAAGVFHGIATGDITLSVQPDPRLTTPPVDYQYASPYSGGAGNASMVSPAIVETVTRKSLGFFNGLVARAQAVSQEPVPYNYGTWTIQGGAGNAKAQMVAGSVPITTIGDIPHLYTELGHWVCDSQATPSPGNSQPCTNGLQSGPSNRQMQYNPVNPYAGPLGIAENLDQSNQSRSVAGLDPTQQSLNWEILWHQQLFAGLSQYFANHPWACKKPPCNSGLGVGDPHKFDYLAFEANYDPHTNFYMTTMAHWDGFPSGIETGSIWTPYSNPGTPYDPGYGWSTKTAGQLSGTP